MTGNRWTLPAALDIGEQPELVAFVGGGGKTSLMFALAAALPGRVVMTTTTRIFAAQMKRAPAVVYADDLPPLNDALAAYGCVLVVGRVEGDKAFGVDPALPARLLARPDVDYVLVEADGSRMRPVKAPAEHEPVIPPETTLLVPVAGLDALEGSIEATAHRPERVLEVTSDELRVTSPETTRGRQSVVGGRLTAVGLARLLTHPNGGLKGVPDGARVMPFLNKVETAERLTAAREAARLMLCEPRVEQVVIGALHRKEPTHEVWRRVAAIVPAAGESRRMGANKLLLPWGATTVLGATLANVRASGVSDVWLVTGYEQDRIAAQVDPERVHLVHNERYAKGMLTSVQAAVQRLPPQTAAILVVLGDQPLVGPEVIDRLLAAYAGSPRGMVAPVHRGTRGNPVLIDRRYFAELLSLPPEAAPRELLRRHADDLRLVEVDSDAVLHDLDQPEDYERLRPRDQRPTDFK